MASPPPEPADPLSLLASLYVSPFLVRLTALPRVSGWRLELSEDDGGTWTSLEPGQPGHASPAGAIDAGAQAIAAWRASRISSSENEIAHYFTNGKLERRKITVTDPDTQQPREVDGYIALDDNGNPSESVDPLEAIRKSKVVPPRALNRRVLNGRAEI